VGMMFLLRLSLGDIGNGRKFKFEEIKLGLNFFKAAIEN